jgi:hypothetical protein
MATGSEAGRIECKPAGLTQQATRRGPGLNKKQAMATAAAWIPTVRLTSLQPAMTLQTALTRTGLALATASALVLTGCQQAQQSVRDATGSAGDAVRSAATGAGQAALAPVVNPVLDLLRKGETELKGGNVAGAAAAMGGFKALWSKAAPVIQPVAGERWPAIEGAANTVLNTFGGGTTPDAKAAGSALSGLIGPLSGLVGK